MEEPKQPDEGMTTGAHFAKVVHEQIESFFDTLGLAISQSPKVVLFVVIVIAGLFAIGIDERTVETRTLKLWVEADSRVTREADRYRDNYGDVVRLQLIAIERSDGSNVASQEGMDYIYRMNRELLSFSVDVSDINSAVGSVSFQDVCDEPDLPSALNTGYEDAFGRSMREVWRFPCIYRRPLDCFSEGGFDYLFPTPAQDPLMLAGENPFDTKVAFLDSTDEEVREVLSDVCRNFGSIAVPENAWMGGVVRNSNNIIESATSLRIVAGGAPGPALAQKFGRYGLDVTEDEAADIELRWEGAFTRHFEELRKEVENEGDGRWRLQIISARTLDDTIDEAIEASAWLVIVGYLVMAVFAMISFSNPKDPLRSRALLGFCGVVLVTLSVMAAFGLSGWFGIPYNPISTQVLPFLALGLGVDDLFVFGAALKEATYVSNEPAMWTRLTFRHAGPSVTLTSLVNFVAFLLASIADIQAVKDFTQQSAIVVFVNYFVILFGFGAMMAIDSRRVAAGKKDVCFCVSAGTTVDKNGEGEMAPKGAARLFIENTYAPLLTNPFVKLVVVALFAAWFAICIWGTSRVERGLRLADVAEEGSFADEYLLLSDRDYGTFPGVLVFNATDGLKHYQDEMRATETQMQSSFGIFQGAVTVQDLGFMQLLNEDFWTIHGVVVDENPSMSIRAADLPCTPVGCTVPQDYNIPVDNFDAYIEALLVTTGFSFEDDFIFKSNDDGSRTLTTSQQTLPLDGLFETDQIVRMMIATRKASDENGVPDSYPFGNVFELWEQYVEIDDTLWSAIGFTMVGVVFVTMLFLLSPSMTMILTVFIFMIEIEIYGVTGFAEIKLNAVTLTNIIMSTAIASELVVHLAFAFMTSTGTRNERMQKALSQMFLPIFNGAFSTLLGVLMLAATEYVYIRKFYFNFYLELLIVGTANALVFLPVTLSIIGPASYEKNLKSQVIPMTKL